MIEDIVLNYLKKGLSVPAYTEVPANPPKSYVLIDKTGGGLIEKTIRRATITIQSYASSLYGASALNEEVVKLMVDAPSKTKEISKSELNSDYEFNDPGKKEKRYQCVFDITYYS